MKKIISLFLVICICCYLTGCSWVKGLLYKIPIFEDSDLDTLTNKAEKAWDEVGKDALKDAAQDAKDAIFGTPEELVWPDSDSMADIPPINSGKISEIKETDVILEVTIKEISDERYNQYIDELESIFGTSVSDGMFKHDNRLISAIYNEENNTLIVTVSSVSQKIEISTDESTVDESYPSEESIVSASAE